MPRDQKQVEDRSAEIGAETTDQEQQDTRRSSDRELSLTERLHQEREKQRQDNPEVQGGVFAPSVTLTQTRATRTASAISQEIQELERSGVVLSVGRRRRRGRGRREDSALAELMQNLESIVAPEALDALEESIDNLVQAKKGGGFQLSSTEIQNIVNEVHRSLRGVDALLYLANGDLSAQNEAHAKLSETLSEYVSQISAETGSELISAELEEFVAERVKGDLLAIGGLEDQEAYLKAFEAELAQALDKGLIRAEDKEEALAFAIVILRKELYAQALSLAEDEERLAAGARYQRRIGPEANLYELFNAPLSDLSRKFPLLFSDLERSDDESAIAVAYNLLSGISNLREINTRTLSNAFSRIERQISRQSARIEALREEGKEEEATILSSALSRYQAQHAQFLKEFRSNIAEGLNQNGQPEREEAARLGQEQFANLLEAARERARENVERNVDFAEIDRQARDDFTAIIGEDSTLFNNNADYIQTLIQEYRKTLEEELNRFDEQEAAIYTRARELALQEALSECSDEISSPALLIEQLYKENSDLFERNSELRAQVNEFIAEERARHLNKLREDAEKIEHAVQMATWLVENPVHWNVDKLLNAFKNLDPEHFSYVAALFEEQHGKDLLTAIRPYLENSNEADAIKRQHLYNLVAALSENNRAGVLAEQFFSRLAIEKDDGTVYDFILDHYKNMTPEELAAFEAEFTKKHGDIDQFIIENVPWGELRIAIIAFRMNDRNLKRLVLSDGVQESMSIRPEQYLSYLRSSTVEERQSFMSHCERIGAVNSSEFFQGYHNSKEREALVQALLEGDRDKILAAELSLAFAEGDTVKIVAIVNCLNGEARDKKAAVEEYFRQYNGHTIENALDSSIVVLSAKEVDASLTQAINKLLSRTEDLGTDLPGDLEFQVSILQRLRQGEEVSEREILTIVQQSAVKLGAERGTVLASERADSSMAANLELKIEELRDTVRVIYPSRPDIERIVMVAAQEAEDRSRFIKASAQYYNQELQIRILKERGRDRLARRAEKAFLRYQERQHDLFEKYPELKTRLNQHREEAAKEFRAMAARAKEIGRNLNMALDGAGTVRWKMWQAIRADRQSSRPGEVRGSMRHSREMLALIKHAYYQESGQILSRAIKGEWELSSTSEKRALDLISSRKAESGEYLIECELPENLFQVLKSTELIDRVVEARPEMVMAVKLRGALEAGELALVARDLLLDTGDRERASFLSTYRDVFGTDFLEDVKLRRGQDGIRVSSDMLIGDTYQFVSSLVKTGQVSDTDIDGYVQRRAIDLAQRKATLQVNEMGLRPDQVERKQIGVDQQFSRIQSYLGDFYDRHNALAKEHLVLLEAQAKTYREELLVQHAERLAYQAEVERLVAQTTKSGKKSRAAAEFDERLANIEELNSDLFEEAAISARFNKVRKEAEQRARVDYNKALKAANKAWQAMEGGFIGLGTEENDLYKALTGLSADQRKILERVYQIKFEVSIYKELNGELETAEHDKALALLDGDRMSALVADIHISLSGMGTNEAVINKSIEELHQIIEDKASYLLGVVREQGKDTDFEALEKELQLSFSPERAAEIISLLKEAEKLPQDSEDAAANAQKLKAIIAKEFKARFEEIYKERYAELFGVENLQEALRHDLDSDELRLSNAHWDYDRDPELLAIVRLDQALNSFWGPNVEAAAKVLEEQTDEEGELSKEKIDHLRARYDNERAPGEDTLDLEVSKIVNPAVRGWLGGLLEADRVAADTHKLRYCLAGAGTRDDLLKELMLPAELQEKIFALESQIAALDVSGMTDAEKQAAFKKHFGRHFAELKKLLEPHQEHIRAIFKKYGSAGFYEGRDAKADIRYDVNSVEAKVYTERLLENNFNSSDIIAFAMGVDLDGTDEATIERLTRCEATKGYYQLLNFQFNQNWQELQGGDLAAAIKHEMSGADCKLIVIELNGAPETLEEVIVYAHARYEIARNGWNWYHDRFTDEGEQLDERFAQFNILLAQILIESGYKGFSAEELEALRKNPEEARELSINMNMLRGLNVDPAKLRLLKQRMEEISISADAFYTQKNAGAESFASTVSMTCVVVGGIVLAAPSGGTSVAAAFLVLGAFTPAANKLVTNGAGEAGSADFAIKIGEGALDVGLAFVGGSVGRKAVDRLARELAKQQLKRSGRFVSAAARRGAKEGLEEGSERVLRSTVREGLEEGTERVGRGAASQLKGPTQRELMRMTRSERRKALSEFGQRLIEQKRWSKAAAGAADGLADGVASTFLMGSYQTLSNEEAFKGGIGHFLNTWSSNVGGMMLYGAGMGVAFGASFRALSKSKMYRDTPDRAGVKRADRVDGAQRELDELTAGRRQLRDDIEALATEAGEKYKQGKQAIKDQGLGLNILKRRALMREANQARRVVKIKGDELDMIEKLARGAEPGTVLYRRAQVVAGLQRKKALARLAGESTEKLNKRIQEASANLRRARKVESLLDGTRRSPADLEAARDILSNRKEIWKGRWKRVRKLFNREAQRELVSGIKEAKKAVKKSKKVLRASRTEAKQLVRDAEKAARETARVEALAAKKLKKLGVRQKDLDAAKKLDIDDPQRLRVEHLKEVADNFASKIRADIRLGRRVFRERFAALRDNLLLRKGADRSNRLSQAKRVSKKAGEARLAAKEDFNAARHAAKTDQHISLSETAKKWLADIKEFRTHVVSAIPQAFNPKKVWSRFKELQTRRFISETDMNPRSWISQRVATVSDLSKAFASGFSVRRGLRKLGELRRRIAEHNFNLKEGKRRLRRERELLKGMDNSSYSREAVKRQAISESNIRRAERKLKQARGDGPDKQALKDNLAQARREKVAAQRERAIQKELRGTSRSEDAVGLAESIVYRSFARNGKGTKPLTKTKAELSAQIKHHRDLLRLDRAETAFRAREAERAARYMKNFDSPKLREHVSELVEIDRRSARYFAELKNELRSFPPDIKKIVSVIGKRRGLVREWNKAQEGFTREFRCLKRERGYAYQTRYAENSAEVSHRLSRAEQAIEEATILRNKGQRIGDTYFTKLTDELDAAKIEFKAAKKRSGQIERGRRSQRVAEIEDELEKARNRGISKEKEKELLAALDLEKKAAKFENGLREYAIDRNLTASKSAARKGDELSSGTDDNDGDLDGDNSSGQGDKGPETGDDLGWFKEQLEEINSDAFKATANAPKVSKSSDLEEHFVNEALKREVLDFDIKQLEHTINADSARISSLQGAERAALNKEIGAQMAKLNDLRRIRELQDLLSAKRSELSSLDPEARRVANEELGALQKELDKIEAKHRGDEGTDGPDRGRDGDDFDGGDGDYSDGGTERSYPDDEIDYDSALPESSDDVMGRYQAEESAGYQRVVDELDGRGSSDYSGGDESYMAGNAPQNSSSMHDAVGVEQYIPAQAQGRYDVRAEGRAPDASGVKPDGPQLQMQRAPEVQRGRVAVLERPPATKAAKAKVRPETRRAVSKTATPKAAEVVREKIDEIDLSRKLDELQDPHQQVRAREEQGVTEESEAFGRSRTEEMPDQGQDIRLKPKPQPEELRQRSRISDETLTKSKPKPKKKPKPDPYGSEVKPFEHESEWVKRREELQRRMEEERRPEPGEDFAVKKVRVKIGAKDKIIGYRKKKRITTRRYDPDKKAFVEEDGGSGQVQITIDGETEQAEVLVDREL